MNQPVQSHISNNEKIISTEYPFMTRIKYKLVLDITFLKSYYKIKTIKNKISALIYYMQQVTSSSKQFTLLWP